LFLASNTVQGYKKSPSLRPSTQDFAGAERAFNVNAKRQITLHTIKYQYIELAVTNRNYVDKETKISILSE